MRTFALLPLLLAACVSAADKWSMVGSTDPHCNPATGSDRGDDHGYGCQQLLDQTAAAFKFDGDGYKYKLYTDKTCNEGLHEQDGSGCVTVDTNARFNSYKVRSTGLPDGNVEANF